jgi:hypothetical protein
MRKWILRLNLLGLIAVVILAVALQFPWWSFGTEFLEQSYVYPYIIDGPVTEIIGYRQSTQMKLLTGVLIGCVALALLGSLIRKWPGRLLLTLSGLVTLYGAYRLFMRITSVAARSGIPIQGTATTYEEFAVVTYTSQLHPGLHLTLLGATLCLLAALLHNQARLRAA